MNKLFNTYKNIAEKVIPVLNENNFMNTGVLTPKEFIIAGDFLVNQNNGWQWQSGDKYQSFLPNKKKYLILKDVKYKNINNLMLSENNDDNWDVYESNNKKETNNLKNKPKDEPKDEPKDDFLDLEDFEMDFSDDETTIEQKQLDVKLYDITITYDNYYRTPRIWFHAYNFSNEPISNQVILNDFSIEHTHVSVTIETHPYINLQSVSVHPCKHAESMKKILKIELENNKDIKVENYFTYFLKFVSCILPHLIFDFTNNT